jgi:hypothetical protein
MKIRSLIVATLVFLVLSGILYWSGHHKEETKVSADTPPTLLKLDESAITRVDLKKKDTAPVVLTRSGSGKWQITEPKPYAADQSAVDSMLSTLSNLSSERLVEEKAADVKAYGLDQPAVELDLSEKDNKSQKLLIGDNTPTGSAVYAMLGGDPRIFTLATYSKTSIDKSLNDLRDKRLLTVDPDKVSRFELLRKNQAIEFGRNKDEWQILKPEPLRADNFQVSELLRKLGDAKMDLNTSSANDDATAFAHATPLATAKITDESGTQELQVRKVQLSKGAGAKTDTYYAKSSAVDGVHKIDADIAQALDKGLDDFRNKKLFDFGYSDPNKIELHSGSKAWFLTRNGEDWWQNGKKMDSGSAQSVVSKLRDLGATSFPSSGFSSPTIEATVTSNDGKRSEKVLIAKSGNNYIARRENEPVLYQLESSSVDGLLKAADDLKPAPPPAK